MLSRVAMGYVQQLTEVCYNQRAISHIVYVYLCSILMDFIYIPEHVASWLVRFRAPQADAQRQIPAE